ncbi:hypothetical protein CBS101457_001656 [Exobasidium rhododendri]|nr:hypothetical protein CBS101457_001656 [Exobasidium rhododendri]
MSVRNRDFPVLHHRESISTLQKNGNSSKDVGTSVQVAVRIRPVTGHDQSSIPARWQRSVVQSISSNVVQVDASGQAPPGATALAPGTSKKQNFTFDRVMGASDGQEQIYNASVMPLISRFLEGYNVTILAYGQTSSGKSYTMGTAVSEVDFESLVAGQRPDLQTGIIPRAVANIFAEMKTNQAAKGSSIQYTAKASFIEIYNEELIDLLADGEGDNRPLVQIREDKAGHIIWSGLKEVRVQNVADVMNRLLQGSSIRRTNETDMNAQSSRSHAIFSLTLTQRKYVGSGALSSTTASTLGIRPPSSFGLRSPTPTGRTTPTGIRSGLPRPASSIAGPASKLASPSRSGTPGGGSSFGLRPSSVLGGGTPGRSSPMPEEARSSGELSEWVTVTSKFHFVDLAGSERLKRTAAQGERVKEGISINAGLHALGNVISALGDPAKSRKTTHIPYRDSKLTRLLQDSLGGNAHTLMIACVSPTEYNVSETINTLQYANRARNIKNKAELNEVEIGWEDVEYLQSQVMKLRKEMQLLKGFKVGTAGSDATIKAIDQKEVMEWQAKYASLSQKFSQLTAESNRLQHQNIRGNGTQDDYYKAAEPIIIEYEKTVDALEGQINLQRAALGHCEDIILASEAATKEQEVRLSGLARELESREQTVVELQARLTKLEDREHTADLYARDLESRLAAHSANGEVEASVVVELRKEIARLREVENTMEQYIKDLESRLSRSDENATLLHDQVARLEMEAGRRDLAYKELQQRMDMLDNSKENKALLEELDRRDTSVMDLQRKVDTLQAERDEIARERGRLTEAAAGRQLEKGKLEDRIRELESNLSSTENGAHSNGLLGASLGSASARGESVTSFGQSVQSLRPIDANNGGISSTEEEISFLQTQVELLSEEMKAREGASIEMQAKMDAVLLKHKGALAEVEALSNQLNLVKLRSTLDTPDDREYMTPGEIPTLSRQSSYNFGASSSVAGGGGGSGSLRARGRPESLLLDNTPARRKSLSRRSSGSFLGYNPKESTPRDGMQTPNSAQQTPSRRGSITAATLADLSPTLFRTRSLSHSLESDSLSGGKRPLNLSGGADLGKLGFTPASNSTGGQGISSSQSMANYERKVASLEAETQRLQEVLKERDDEIIALEQASRASNQTSEARLLSNDKVAKETNVGMADEHASEVDELMRAMARKESESRQRIEELQVEMLKFKKDLEVSQALSENQRENMTMEIESLQTRESELTLELEKARREHLQQVEDSAVQHKSDLDSLRQSHEVLLDNITRQHFASRESMMAEHETILPNALQKAREEQDEQHSVVVKALQEEHAKSLSSLQSAHAASLTSAVEAIHQRHVTTLGESEAEVAERRMEEQRRVGSLHQEQLAALQQSHVEEVEKTRSALQDEHSNVLTTLRESHDVQIEALHSQHTRAIDEINAKHAEVLVSPAAALDLLVGQHRDQVEETRQEGGKAVQMKENEHTLALAAVKGEYDAVLAQVKGEHALELSKAEQDIQDAKTQHATALEVIDGEKMNSRRDLERLQQNHLHTLEQLEALKSAHLEQLRSLTDEHASRVEELEGSLKEAVFTRNAIAASHGELQEKHLKLMEQDPHEVDALRSELAETSDALVILEGALTDTQEERDGLVKELEAIKSGRNVVVGGSSSSSTTITGSGSSSHGEVKMLAQSQKEVELLQANLANVRSELQRSKSDIQGMLEDKTRQESNVREMQIKLAIAETRSATNRRNSRDGSHNGLAASPSSSDSVMNSLEQGGLRSPNFTRKDSTDTDVSRSSRSLGVGAGSKPPPLTPPPNIPPPPTPSFSNGNTTPTQGHRTSSGIRSSTSSSSILLQNRPDSPNDVLTRSSSSTSINSQSLNGNPPSDPKMTKLLCDQAEELKNIARQLNHCEQDLQANIDLVATLEAALNDSERNLRKSRLQLSEATRERDRYAMQADELRSQVTQAQRETDNVRNSVLLEKQGFESKLQMEREAKENARRALEARLDEVQKKKNGKLFCM